MSKTKKSPNSLLNPKLSAQPTEQPAAQAPWIRETVESIVIAFVLAFLFRTFEAEAFVIPTGSMAPTLMGEHKDVFCTQCGHRFQVNASIDETQSREAYECVSGVCPNCRYTMPMTANLPSGIRENYPAPDVSRHSSYNGDRILVNKYIYAIGEPARWDIVVFHYPGDAQMNFIKRLVGLPGEMLRIFQGDLFVKDRDGGTDGEFRIEQKPAEKLLAMRQLVHDTEYDPTSLFAAGWPLRWSGSSAGEGAWKLNSTAEGRNVQQRLAIDSAANELSWIRYRNFVPNFAIWQELLQAQQRAGANSGEVKFPTSLLERLRPRLVTDFNAYNTRVVRHEALSHQSLSADATKLGLHWVGDLMVEADVEVEEARGELVFDLVEGGKHFTCKFDLATGRATLEAGIGEFAPMAQTVVKKPGRYRIGFANFDDQLRLFVKEPSFVSSEFSASDMVEFDTSTSYDAAKLFGERDQIIPVSSDEDAGDLAPAGIGARGAKLTITRLQIWRDIYYIADSSHIPHAPPITDFVNLTAQIVNELPYDPSLWSNFRDRRRVEFKLDADQYFVMGDNSPESSDARLWRGDNGRGGGRPGGDYLERRLLIGKALCVYWPHSWNRIPGTPIPFPFFPNFEDMRLVR